MPILVAAKRIGVGQRLGRIYAGATSWRGSRGEETRQKK